MPVSKAYVDKELPAVLAEQLFGFARAKPRLGKFARETEKFLQKDRILL